VRDNDIENDGIVDIDEAAERTDKHTAHEREGQSNKIFSLSHTRARRSHPSTAKGGSNACVTK